MPVRRLVGVPARRCAAAVLGVALWAVPSTLLACPMCKDAVDGDGIGRALSWTTLLMIAMPMVLVGTIGGWVFMAYWRAARRAAGTDAAMRVVSWPVWPEKERET